MHRGAYYKLLWYVSDGFEELTENKDGKSRAANPGQNFRRALEATCQTAEARSPSKTTRYNPTLCIDRPRAGTWTPRQYRPRRGSQGIPFLEFDNAVYR